MKRRAPLAACGAAVLAIAFAASALAWTAPRGLAPGAQAPLYAVDGQGHFYALFAESAGGPGYQLFSKQDLAGAVARVDSDTAPAGGDYTLAVAPSGAASAVWCSAASSTASPGVYAAFRPAGGGFGAPQQLAAPVAADGIGDSCSVEAAAGPAGAMVAAWHLTGSAGNTLSAAKLTSGNQFGPPDVLDTNSSDQTLPVDTVVDGAGRATVAWLSNGNLRAAREAAADDAFSVRETVGKGCDFGDQPVRLAADNAGNVVMLFVRCASRKRHVFELAHAAVGKPFGTEQRVTKTRFGDVGLAVGPGGALGVTWRSLHGNLYASTGRAANGIQRRQRLTLRAPQFRNDIDTHSTAIDARGRIVVAWIQRSLQPNATARVVTSGPRGHFGGVTVLPAAGGIGARVAVNAAGATVVDWEQPTRCSRGTCSKTHRIVAATRSSGGRFRRPAVVVRNGLAPSQLLATGHLALVTWVTSGFQPRLATGGL